MAMKKLFLTGVAALSLLNAAGATSVEVPKQYRGQWCYIDIQNDRAFRRCRKSNGEGAPAITREVLYLGEPDSVDEACRVVSVKPTAKGHRASVESCGNSKAIDLWLDARGHLHIDGVRVEVPAQYRGKWCGGENRLAYRCQEPTTADIGKDRVDNIPLEKVTRTAKGHRLHITVDTEPERLDLWFDTRRRLHMRWLDYGEK
jgi:hypothetical protein